MMKALIDVLMITYNRPVYTRLALKKLLDSCDDQMRVWVWQNGSDEATLSAVNDLRGHPRFYRFHHSIENKKLTQPTNWLWANATGDFLGKVDDDCLVPIGWGAKLRHAHEQNPRLGCIACWPFSPEDFDPSCSIPKIHSLNGGHKLLRHPWVGGSGYIMKRECVAQGGLLTEQTGFPDYLRQLAWLGWIHGWYFPLLYQDHMDDPRSEYTLLKSDADIAKYMPLTALKNNTPTVEAWTELITRTARHIQESSSLPGKLYCLRMPLRRMRYIASRWLHAESPSVGKP